MKKKTLLRRMAIQPLTTKGPLAVFLVAVLSLLPSTATQAQAIKAWVQRFNGPGNGDDSARAVVVDTNGNVYVTGSSFGGDPLSGGSGYDWATIAYSSTGVPLWTNYYNGPGNGYDFPEALVVDNSGNLIVTGSSSDVNGNGHCATIKYSSAGVPSWTNVYSVWISGGRVISVDVSDNVSVTGTSQISGSIAGFTIKYSSAGALLWTRTYNCSPSAAAVDASGNAFVTGVAPNYQDYTTIKYSSTGVQLWSRVWKGQGMPFALAVDAGGNVVVAGRSGSSATGNNYATIKYSSAGVLVWTNIYTGPGGDEDDAQAVAVDASGNVFVTGSTWRGAAQADYGTIKYSSTGVPLWTNFYNGPGNGSDNGWALALDASGNVYVTGGSEGGGSGWDYATVAYSNAGMPLWTNRYNGPANDRDEAHALAVDGSGNVIVTGFSYNGGSGDFATVKYVIPPIITRQPLSRTNAVGTTASFTVEVAGSAPFSYQWRGQGTNLVDGGNISGVTTTNLMIANVQLADAAGYTVVVTNAYGSVTSILAQLTVTIPPSPGRFTRLSYSPETGLSFIFRDATVGQPYRIQRSSSMAEGSWTDWQSFTYTEPVGLMDVGATGAERRFYRAVSP
jgi:hypothetical protein